VKTVRFEADAGLLDDTPLPEAATRIIHTLACKVSLCSRMPPGECEVVATIRGRPVDGQGRGGCHVEFHTGGPPPVNGLHAVQRAGGELVMAALLGGAQARLRDQPVVALHALKLEEVLMGGWRVTMDLRWYAA